MLLTKWHRFPDRSLFKAARLLQKLAVPLALSLRQGKGVREIVSLFQECFHTCRVDKRRGKPATFQRLLALEPMVRSFFEAVSQICTPHMYGFPDC